MTLLDLILAPIFLLLIYLFARYNVNKHIQEKSYYKYYIPGLLTKLFGGFCVCLIYTFYYKGGDTTNFYHSDLVMINLLNKSPQTFFSIMRGNFSTENYLMFDNDTGWPNYWYDHHTFFVVRITALICLLGFKSYLATTLLLAWFCFSGIWRLFNLFCELFPTLTRQFSIVIFYIPSVAFWGSGLLKDTITLSAICWFTFCFYKCFIKKESFIWNFIYLIISAYLIVSIKAYILYALLPGAFLWITFSSLGNIENKIIRGLVAPFLLLGGSLSVFLLLQQLSSEMGKFNIYSILERAVITQQDLVKDYYGGTTFDIGKFEPNIPSMLAKAPIAIISGLFRPFLWESNNPVMIFSSIENTVIIAFTIMTIIKLKLFNFITLLKKNPILIYSFSFALCFAFSVGLSTPNFGSLVRYRIPAIPFFLCSLILLRYYYDEKIKKRILKAEIEEEDRLASKERFIIT